MQKDIGLYIHVPFCISKCPYCDFYSLTGQEEEQKEAFAAAVLLSLKQWRERTENLRADTLYFGGGTPSLLGGERIARIIRTASELYGLNHAEITMEANPGDSLERVFHEFAAAGGNRVSIGMQSSNALELKGLGRRHNPKDVAVAVACAHAAGIDNVSLDMMLGIENQTVESIKDSIRTVYTLGARHVSAYMLKIEEGTPYYKKQTDLILPDEEKTADMYLAACEELEAVGYRQYEISNFAVPGFESRHNLKYWNADPYLGIGPSAHSFLGGKRFFYPRDMEAFLKNAKPEDERVAGESEALDYIADAGMDEYIMLRLRLKNGVAETDFVTRFGCFIPAGYKQRASRFPKTLVMVDKSGIRLTRQGFLLSNPLIARIIG